MNLTSCPENYEANPVYDKLLNGPLSTTTIILGLVFNTLSIGVFSTGTDPERNHLPSSPKRNPYANYLVALSIWDNLLLLSAFFLYNLTVLLYGYRTATGLYVYIYPFSYPLGSISQTALIWTAVLLTLDRCLFIVQPLRQRPSSNPNRARRTLLAILAVSIFSILWGIPLIFEIRIANCLQSTVGTELILLTVESTAFRTNQLHQYYRLVSSVAVQSFAPILLLFFLIWRMCMELRKAQIIRRTTLEAHQALSERETNNEQQQGQAETRDNCMLLCVAFKFLLARLLPAVLDISESIFDLNYVINSQTLQIVANVSNALIVLNSATNFWVYFLVGSRFRRNCARFLFSWKCRS